MAWKVRVWGSREGKGVGSSEGKGVWEQGR